MARCVEIGQLAHKFAVIKSSKYHPAPIRGFTSNPIIFYDRYYPWNKLDRWRANEATVSLSLSLSLSFGPSSENHELEISKRESRFRANRSAGWKLEDRGGGSIRDGIATRHGFSIFHANHVDAQPEHAGKFPPSFSLHPARAAVDGSLEQSANNGSVISRSADPTRPTHYPNTSWKTRPMALFSFKITPPPPSSPFPAFPTSVIINFPQTASVSSFVSRNGKRHYFERCKSIHSQTSDAIRQMPHWGRERFRPTPIELEKSIHLLPLLDPEWKSRRSYDRKRRKEIRRC